MIYLADDERAVVAYIRNGLADGKQLFLPSYIYVLGVSALREAGATEDELSRVHLSQPIPTS